MTSHVPKHPRKSIEDMVKSLKVDPLAKVTASTNSMVSKKENKSQPAPYYETLETYQGLPCPYGGYYGYYYPGLDGSVGEAKDNGYYGYGTDVQYPVMQGENGSLIYMMPGYQSYDVSPTYMPVSPVGVSTQGPIYAAQGYYQNQYGYGDASSPTYLWDPVYGVASSTQPLKQNISSSSQNHNNYHPKSKNSFGDRPKTPRKNSYSPLPQHNQERGGTVYPMDPLKKKSGGLNRDETEKAKARNKENGDSKNGLENGEDHITNGECESCSLDVEGNEKGNGVGSVIRRDQYNLSSFQTKYEEAIFFVIKSYSEDDIHKSIKYNVWSSTLNGNKKLDNAYQESQKKIAEKGGKCPIFLFFSVNASGQFCGVAEMIGRVDYEKSMEFWQQDKWTGYFPVKWHIIKDVPNPQLRHIILENNENKPVTNSRDTQEVRLPQGNEVLNIFKNYAAKTSILDDFDFYENREKVMVQKKLRFPPVQIKKKEEDLAADFKTLEISSTVKEAANTEITETVN